MANSALENLLNSTHPIYDYWLETWRQNERRFNGGHAVVNEDLMAFDWEEENGDHFKKRKSSAVFVNFPARVSLTMMGSLEEKAPQPGKGLNFGGLGNHTKPNEMAYHIWNNADGAGMDGSSWDAWWNTAHQYAMVTGHRWQMAESPQVNRPGEVNQVTLSEALASRPYLVEFSPINVPNWLFDEKGLAWCLIKLNKFETSVDNGTVKTKAVKWSYIHVRKGYTGLDAIIPGASAGGWYMYNSKHVQQSAGNYDKTDGLIPIWNLFYERAKSQDDQTPMMSRPGLSEIASIAVNYMNLSSAGDHDAIAVGSRTLFLLGVGSGEHGQVVEQVRMGGRVIGIPKPTPESPNPEVYEMASSGANEAINSRLTARKGEVAMVAADETEMAPGASGVSKEASHKDRKSPRLRNLAKERESAQKTALWFLEKRAGVETPSATVKWPKDFPLTHLVAGVLEVLGVLTQLGVNSPTLAGQLVKTTLIESGISDTFESPDTMKEVIGEVEASSARVEQQGDFLGNSGGLPGGGDPEEA